MKPSTGAHTGTGTWLVQRATAVVLAVALPALTLHFVTASAFDFAGWRALFAPLWVRVTLLLTMTTLALHAWVGMRDILMDYVHSIGVRLALYLAVIVSLAGSVAWLAMIVFGTTPWSTT